LIKQANADLANGASLPPSFQAELVKAGLENAGTAGGNASSSGAAGTNIRQLLGLQGIQLQQSRANEAQNLMGTASNLQGARQATLTNLATLDDNLRQQRFNRGYAAAQLGSSSIPTIGLSGGDAVNMDIGNINQKNQVTLGMGGLDAQKALVNGQMWQSIIGSGSNAIGSILGGMGGGAAGGMLSGLTSGGSAAGGTTAAMNSGSSFNALGGLLSNFMRGTNKGFNSYNTDQAYAGLLGK
jgi:hypothetical protein